MTIPLQRKVILSSQISACRSLATGDLDIDAAQPGESTFDALPTGKAPTIRPKFSNRMTRLILFNHVRCV